MKIYQRKRKTVAMLDYNETVHSFYGDLGKYKKMLGMLLVCVEIPLKLKDHSSTFSIQMCTVVMM